MSTDEGKLRTRVWLLFMKLNRQKKKKEHLQKLSKSLWNADQWWKKYSELILWEEKAWLFFIPPRSDSSDVSLNTHRHTVRSRLTFGPLEEKQTHSSHQLNTQPEHNIRHIDNIKQLTHVWKQSGTICYQKQQNYLYNKSYFWLNIFEIKAA